jgi:hypothetical protein
MCGCAKWLYSVLYVGFIDYGGEHMNPPGSGDWASMQWVTCENAQPTRPAPVIWPRVLFDTVLWAPTGLLTGKCSVE